MNEQQLAAGEIRQGLTAAQVQQRIEDGLVSGSPAPAGKTEKQIFLSHLFTFFNLIFAVLAVVLVIAGSSVKNMSFLVVVVINTAIGAIQEIRAKRSVDSLTLLARHPVKVVRDGELTQVAADSVVRDDLAEFTIGDQICGDGFLRSGALWVNESLLTGEEDSIAKQPGDELHSGSIVVAGTGRVQLTAVGDSCSAAKLTREARTGRKAGKSEMMRSLDRLIVFVGIALVPVGIILFRQEYVVLQLGLRKSAEGTVAAITGMIPEGLYLLTSIALAMSSWKLGRQKVLVQDRSSIEALARVDVLCVDKTGTITLPDMDLETVLPLEENDEQTIADILTAMYSGQSPENATERAIAEVYGGRACCSCTDRVPFSSEYKWSGCCLEDRGSFILGAPDYLLSEGDARNRAQELAQQGYRVLMLARYADVLIPGALEEEKLEPMALLLLTSRLRPNAAQTFSYFAQQGVTVKVISGDNPATVSRIAMAAGIPGAENYVDATSLQSEVEYQNALRSCTVFGRVTPKQKKRLIATLQADHHTVAMTGDGVNDLLAMKQADCSVAMASGAEAASQMASLVLLDNDFSAMPGVVAEGRRVVNNIQRSATLFLVKNIFSLFLSIITLFTNWPYPLEPIHLTVISAVTIGIPSYILTLEPRYDRISGRFLRGVLRRALPGGLTNVFVVLVCQLFMQVFALSSQTLGTVCAAVLGVVGLLVLWQVCKPFNFFRSLMWIAMAAGLLVSFTYLGELFSLTTAGGDSLLIMGVLLMMTPTVFFAVQKAFDWMDRMLAWLRGLPRAAGRKVKSVFHKS